MLFSLGNRKFVIISIVLLPTAYLLYAFILGGLGLASVDLSQTHPLLTPLFLLSLAYTGGLLYLALHNKLYLTTTISAAMIILFPYVFGGSITAMDAGYFLLVFSVTVISSILETTLRQGRKLIHYVQTDIGLMIITSALVYLGLVLWLQAFSRNTEWMQEAFLNPVGIMFFLVLCLGSMVVGGIAAWLWIYGRRVLPLIAAYAWLGWGFVLLIEEGPLYLGHFTGIAWVGLTPYPDTLMHWPQALLLVFTAAATEKLINRIASFFPEHG